MQQINSMWNPTMLAEASVMGALAGIGLYLLWRKIRTLKDSAPQTSFLGAMLRRRRPSEDERSQLRHGVNNGAIAALSLEMSGRMRALEERVVQLEQHCEQQRIQLARLHFHQPAAAPGPSAAPAPEQKPAAIQLPRTEEELAAKLRRFSRAANA
jgi:hypothetical protein